MFTGFFFTCYGDHRYLHGLTPSFPTRRSSDLATVLHADLSTSTKTVANLGGGSTADVDAGDVLEYTITLIESAGAIAGNVHLTDTIQAGLGSLNVTMVPGGATDNSSGSAVDKIGRAHV